MKTILFYQNKKPKKYFFNIFLFLGLSIVTVISCSDSNAGPTPKEDLNTFLFTYVIVKYTEGSTTNATSSPTWTGDFSSTGITYSIAVATSGNIPGQNGTTDGTITINSNTGVITVNNATLSNSGDYLVIATAGSGSDYEEGSAQITTFSLAIITSDGKITLNNFQFTYDTVEYKIGSIVDVISSSPTWTRDFSSTGITYSIAAVTSGNIPDQTGITDGAVTINPNTGVITVNNATFDHLGDYLVTATAGGSSNYIEGSTQTATFTLAVRLFPLPGMPILSYALRIDGMTVRLTPHADNPYGSATEENIPTFASYNFYYTPSSSFTITPTPQEVMSNSTAINISNVTGPTNFVITNLTQDTEYYIVVESIHAFNPETAIFSVFTKRTASIRTSDRATLCTTVSDIVATNRTADLNHIDTSQVTDMASLFSKDYECTTLSFVADTRNYMTNFNGDISDWDTSSVNNMQNMFSYANGFNGDISSWNTSSVNNMQNMFANANGFNGDISSWNTSKVTNMAYMFTGATVFNQNISGWDISNVITMEYMFYYATALDQNFSNWDVTGKTTTAMFRDASSMQPDNYPQGYTP